MSDESRQMSSLPAACPLCDINLLPLNVAGYHDHPSNDCLLSGFEISVDDLGKWNRRAASPAHTESAAPVAWLIDWPDEPELGHYFGEEPCLGARNRPLVLASSPAPSPVSAESAAPVDMVLFCPRCGVQHIDGPEWADDPHDIEQGQMRVWENPPHRSHLCHHCGLIWRPADVPTNGVASIKTRGKNDSPPPAPSPVSGADERAANERRYLQLRERMVQTEPPISQGHVGGASLDGVLDALHESRSTLAPTPTGQQALSDAIAAETACAKCGMHSVQACNDMGCGYLESGNGEPSSMSDAAAPQAIALTDALRELVELKDLKEKAESIHFAGPLSESGENWKNEYVRLRAEYTQRQPGAWDRARALLAATPAPASSWRTGTPPVENGKCQELILAVRRVNSGHVHVFAANFANNFTDDGCLSGHNGNEYVADGWYLRGLDTSGEFDEVYESITLNEGDEIVGWHPLPVWATPAPATADALTDAARDVLAERRRQVEQEGWTPEHDDEHRGGQMPMAAASYAVAASYAAAGLYPMPKGKPPTSWPWDKSWWKPGKSRRMLIKAGALILAEIERLDRAAMSRSDS